MPRKKQETLQPGHSLFDVLTDPRSQPSPIHSDVADTHVEELPGNVEQSPLFADAKPARRVVTAKNVSSEPLDVSALTQTEMFEDTGQLEIRTIADCFVTRNPFIEETEKKVHGKIIKRREWKCTFISPPDLWHLDNPAIVHVTAIDPETIEHAKAAKLQRGNYAKIKGKVVSESLQPMGKNAEPRQITHLILTEIVSVERLSSAKTKTNIAPLRARRG